MMGFFVVGAMKGTFCLFIPRTESVAIVSLVLDLICPVSSAYFRTLQMFLAAHWYPKGEISLRKEQEGQLHVYLQLKLHRSDFRVFLLKLKAEGNKERNG